MNYGTEKIKSSSYDHIRRCHIGNKHPGHKTSLASIIALYWISVVAEIINS